MIRLFFYPNKDEKNPSETYTKTELEVAYNAARTYIMGTKEGRKLFKKVESSSTLIHLHINYSRKGNTFEHINGTQSNNLYWNPNTRLYMRNGSQTPAMGLAHEMGHAYQLITNRKGYEKGTGADHLKIENENLKAFETPIAKRLGEPTRVNYRDANMIGSGPGVGRKYKNLSLRQRVTFTG